MQVGREAAKERQELEARLEHRHEHEVKALERKVGLMRSQNINITTFPNNHL